MESFRQHVHNCRLYTIVRSMVRGIARGLRPRWVALSALLMSGRATLSLAPHNPEERDGRFFGSHKDNKKERWTRIPPRDTNGGGVNTKRL